MTIQVRYTHPLRNGPYFRICVGGLGAITIHSFGVFSVEISDRTFYTIFSIATNNLIAFIKVNMGLDADSSIIKLYNHMYTTLFGE